MFVCLFVCIVPYSWIIISDPSTLAGLPGGSLRVSRCSSFGGCRFGDVILIFINGDVDGRSRYGNFHHIIHLVNIIGVTKFGGSKEVNNF